MIKFLKIFKKIFLPITLLTVLSLLCLIVLAEALYMNYASPNLFSGMYLSIVIPITLVIWVLYFIDRILLNKISYKVIILSEIGLSLLLFLIFSYQNSKTTIRFETNKSYVLVIFDSDKTSSITFQKKGLFNKEVVIKDTNLIYLNSSYEYKNELKIETPKNWIRTTTDQNNFTKDGKNVGYIFVTNSELPKSYLINNEKYIDSLLQVNTIK